MNKREAKEVISCVLCKVFNIGNYFQTEEEARIYAEKFKHILKGRINNEQN